MNEKKEKLIDVLKAYFSDIFEPDDNEIEKESTKLANLIIEIFEIME